MTDTKTPAKSNKKPSAIVPNQTPKRRRQSQPVLKRQLKLQSASAQNLYQRVHERVAKAFFHIDTIMPNLYSEQMAVINALDKEITLKIDKTFSELQQAIEQSKVLAENLGIEVEGKNRATYTDTMNIVVDIDSPKFGHYLNLIERFDLLVLYIDTLWLNGELSAAARLGQVKNWQGRIARVGNQSVNYQRRVQDSVLRHNDENAIEKIENELGIELNIHSNKDSLKQDDETDLEDDQDLAIDDDSGSEEEVALAAK